MEGKRDSDVSTEDSIGTCAVIQSKDNTTRVVTVEPVGSMGYKVVVKEGDKEIFNIGTDIFPTGIYPVKSYAMMVAQDYSKVKNIKLQLY